MAAGWGFTDINGIPGFGVDGQTLEESKALALSAGAGLLSATRRHRCALNTGEAITPMNIGLVPNVEYNGRSTRVMNGDFGNRLDLSAPGAVYRVMVRLKWLGLPS